MSGGGNPYHDARGRFTTAGGNRTGTSVPEYGRGRPNAANDIPERWVRYYDHIKDVPDRTNAPGVKMLPTDLVHHYREYDRAPNDGNMKVVEKLIKEQGIRTPIVLEVNSFGGMIGEGNHRIAAAKKLGIKNVPVVIVHKGTINKNDVSSRGVSQHPAGAHDALGIDKYGQPLQ